jgi:hypothetical protein
MNENFENKGTCQRRSSTGNWIGLLVCKSLNNKAFLNTFLNLKDKAT